MLVKLFLASKVRSGKLFHITNLEITARMADIFYSLASHSPQMLG